DLRGIEAYSCAGILGVDTIAIPSGVTYIDDFAFYGCETLQYADFGESSDLKSIGRYAFWDCLALKEAVLPEGLETIEENVFSGCKSLSKLVFPSTIRSIGTWIAYGAVDLTEATYRGSVEEWEAMEKDDEWHYRTSCAVVHCQNGDVLLA
ncbi:MAG: leucine-rich repeat domain-containing protein, partial [Bacilli bacterium]|nr:leucine-rich repeat domain-containing protein [Bacilli bacterium]